jgi:hypothetical protein
MEAMRNACMVGISEGNRPLGRRRREWADNIKTGLTEIGRGSVDWIHLAQDKDAWRGIVNTIMNLRVSIRWGIYRLAERLLASQEGLFSWS